MLCCDEKWQFYTEIIGATLNYGKRKNLSAKQGPASRWSTFCLQKVIKRHRIDRKQRKNTLYIVPKNYYRNNIQNHSSSGNNINCKRAKPHILFQGKPSILRITNLLQIITYKNYRNDLIKCLTALIRVIFYHKNEMNQQNIFNIMRKQPYFC